MVGGFQSIAKIAGIKLTEEETVFSVVCCGTTGMLAFMFLNLNFTVPAGGVVEMKSYVNSFWSSTLKEYQTWRSQLINFTVNWVYIVLALEVHFHINKCWKIDFEYKLLTCSCKTVKEHIKYQNVQSARGKNVLFSINIESSDL